MQQKIDKVLSAAEWQALQDSIAQLNDKLNFAQGLTTAQKRKGGWYMSMKARHLAEKTLVVAKQMPAYYPLVDVAAFERDVALLRQLHTVLPQIDQLKSKVESTLRVLQKETSEQAFYVYNQLQLMHDNGIGYSEPYSELKPLMPRSGKKQHEESQ